jgi:outer membrane protein assembly factor BamB
VGGPAVVPAEAGSPALVVVVAGDDRAHAFDLAPGRERWAAAVDGAGSPEVPPLPLTQGRVLVADRQGGLALLDADGQRRWHASSDGAAVRGGPAGPGPDGRYFFPLDDGRLVAAGPGRRGDVMPAGEGRISGVAVVPGVRPAALAHALVVATREAAANQVVAYGPP